MEIPVFSSLRRALDQGRPVFPRFVVGPSPSRRYPYSVRFLAEISGKEQFPSSYHETRWAARLTGALDSFRRAFLPWRIYVQIVPMNRPPLY